MKSPKLLADSVLGDPGTNLPGMTLVARTDMDTLKRAVAQAAKKSRRKATASKEDTDDGRRA